MTIKQSATKVLQDAGSPLSLDEIFDGIRTQGLFEFKASSPKSVLSRQLRKHTAGVEMKLASDEKCFRLVDGKFALI